METPTERIESMMPAPNNVGDHLYTHEDLKSERNRTLEEAISVVKELYGKSNYFNRTCCDELISELKKLRL